MGTISTANFPALLWPGLKGGFGDEYQATPTVYDKIYEMRKSTKAYERNLMVTTLPLAARKPEGAPISYADRSQGPSKEWVHGVYALGMTITEEMVEDDQYDRINNSPKLLARSMRQTEETVAASVFNEAFTTSLSADGQPLLSNSHPLYETGGTASNVLTTPSDLAQASLQQMMLMISDVVDDRGLPIVIGEKRLIIHEQSRFDAQVILQTQQKTGSEHNDINPMAGILTPTHWRYLNDPDAWFIQTDVPEGLIWYTRREARPRRDDEFDTFNLKFSIDARFSCGAADWRCLYGTTGAG